MHQLINSQRQQHKEREWEKAGAPNTNVISSKMCPFLFCWSRKVTKYESKTGTFKAVAENG